VTEYLGIDQAAAFQGMLKAYPDFGSLKIWRIEQDSPAGSWYFASLFSANDPESTRLALARLQEKGLLEKRQIIGLLCLRSDRGDRSLQWLEAFKDGVFPDVNKLALFGEQAWLLKKKLKAVTGMEICIFKKQAPENVMAQLLAAEKKGAVLLGIGNMGGPGESFVNYWEKTGKPYDA
ncbi:poly-gamma-glutamate synthase PgsB, partial [Acidobacteriota bacterium]